MITIFFLKSHAHDSVAIVYGLTERKEKQRPLKQYSDTAISESDGLAVNGNAISSTQNLTA